MAINKIDVRTDISVNKISWYYFCSGPFRCQIQSEKFEWLQAIKKPKNTRTIVENAVTGFYSGKKMTDLSS